MTIEIKFRQAEWKDENIIAEFYKKGYGNQAHFKYPKRFMWLYKNSPYRNGETDLPIYIALDGTNVVGMSTLLYQQFAVKGKELSGAWCCDLRILPEYRRMGIASRLEQMRMDGINAFSVSSSDISINLKKKLGYLVSQSYTKYILFKSLDADYIYDDLTRYLNIKRNTIFFGIGRKLGVHLILKKILNSILQMKQNIKATNNSRTNPTIIFQNIERFDARANMLWDNIKHQYGLVATRNDEYLNWKYTDQPDMDYLKYLAIQDGAVKGIVVMRKSGDAGIISEIYANQKENIINDLLCFSVNKLIENKCSRIACCGSTAEFCMVLEKHGFIPIIKRFGVFSLKKSDRIMKENLLKLQWLIGYGDHDLDEPGNICNPSLIMLLKAILKMH